MEFIWLCLFLIFVIIEIISINLVTIWFAAGALITGICSLFITNGYILTIIFLVISTVCLVVTRPILIKYYKNRPREKTNFDRIIEMKAIVTEKITALEIGEVKVDGKLWSAKASTDIQVGEIVSIESIDGAKLIVRKEEK